MQTGHHLGRRWPPPAMSPRRHLQVKAGEIGKSPRYVAESPSVCLCVSLAGPRHRRYPTYGPSGTSLGIPVRRCLVSGAHDRPASRLVGRRTLMTDSRRVEFSTRDGITLRGDFYQAAGDRVGVVVMLNGLSPRKKASSATSSAGFRRQEYPHSTATIGTTVRMTECAARRSVFCNRRQTFTTRSRWRWLCRALVGPSNAYVAAEGPVRVTVRRNACSSRGPSLLPPPV